MTSTKLQRSSKLRISTKPKSRPARAWSALFAVILSVPISGCSIESTAKEQAVTQASLVTGRSGSTWVAAEDSVPTHQSQGDDIVCGEAVVGTGEGTIELSLELPDGYELSEFAPLSVSLFSENSQVVWTEEQQPEWTFEIPRFPLELPVRFATGQTAVRLDIAAYYCESGRKYLCQIARLHALVPVSVSPDVPSNTLRVEIPVPAP